MNQLLSYVDRCEDNDVVNNREMMRQLCHLKHRDILKETLQEYSRRGNFLRIYPSKGMDYYDLYFVQPRPLNRFLFKMLYTDELSKLNDLHPFPQGDNPALRQSAKPKPGGEQIVVQLRVSKKDEETSNAEYISMPLEEILTGVEDVVSKKMQSKI